MLLIAHLNPHVAALPLLALSLVRVVVRISPVILGSYASG